MFLAAERGIPHNPEQHAAYVGSWVKALKQDKNEIFRAAHDASAATDFLFALERDRSIAEEDLATAALADPSASSPAALEAVTAELHHDRERLEEPEAAVSDAVREHPPRCANPRSRWRVLSREATR